MAQPRFPIRTCHFSSADSPWDPQSTATVDMNTRGCADACSDLPMEGAAHALVPLPVISCGEVRRNDGQRPHAFVQIVQQAGDLVEHLLPHFTACHSTTQLSGTGRTNLTRCPIRARSHRTAMLLMREQCRSTHAEAPTMGLDFVHVQELLSENTHQTAAPP